jgi:hypothetical protein
MFARGYKLTSGIYLQTANVVKFVGRTSLSGEVVQPENLLW